MRYITIFLAFLVLVASSGIAQASDFKISFGYNDCDRDGCGVITYNNERYDAGRYRDRYHLYKTYSWPQYYFLQNFYPTRSYYQTYVPKTRQCYVATDKYGRKFRKCVWVRDSGCQARPYGQTKSYCWYK